MDRRVFLRTILACVVLPRLPRPKLELGPDKITFIKRLLNNSIDSHDRLIEDKMFASLVAGGYIVRSDLS